MTEVSLDKVDAAPEAAKLEASLLLVVPVAGQERSGVIAEGAPNPKH